MTVKKRALPAHVQRNRAAADRLLASAKQHPLLVFTDADTITELSKCVYHTGRTGHGDQRSYLATTANHAGAVLLALECLGCVKVRSHARDGAIEWKVKVTPC